MSSLINSIRPKSVQILNKDMSKTKLIRVGDNIYMCDMIDGELVDEARKFINNERIKQWHKTHNPEKPHRHCPTCACESQVDEKRQ